MSAAVRRLVPHILLGAALLASSGVWAAAPGGRPGRSTHLRLQAVKVAGKAQRPQAFFVLPRSAVSFTPMAARPALTPRIIQSLAEQPF